jgi:hypothetical protein
MTLTELFVGLLAISQHSVRIAEIFFTPTLLLVTKEVDSSPFTRGRQSLANREGCLAEEMPQLARRKSKWQAQGFCMGLRHTHISR